MKYIAMSCLLLLGGCVQTGILSFNALVGVRQIYCEGTTAAAKQGVRDQLTAGQKLLACD